MNKQQLINECKSKFYDQHNRTWTKNSEYFYQCRTEKELKHFLKVCEVQLSIKN